MKFQRGVCQAAAIAAIGFAATLTPMSVYGHAGNVRTKMGVFATADGNPVFTGVTRDFHGYVTHSFTVDGCNAIVAEPKTALAGRPWVWRTMFWDAFPSLDIDMLRQGYYVATIDVGDTWASPDSLKHYDAFFSELTGTYGLANKVVLEGLSRGGLFAFRWAYLNPTKVAVLYGDAPVGDIKTALWGKDSKPKNNDMWQAALNAYHFTEQQMLDFTGNPIDNLAPLAANKVPIIDVCGDSDHTLPKEEQSDIIRDRYVKLHGRIVEIVKQGCDHHPHGLTDPTMIADYILAYSAGGDVAAEAKKTAPKPGSVILLPEGKW